MKIPLLDYLTKKSEELKVFRLRANPSRTPLDINISALISKYDFNPEVDRFRFWSRKKELEKEVEKFGIRLGLTIIKFSLKKDYCLYMKIEPDGKVEILSNDDQLAKQFFIDMLINVPPTFMIEDEFQIEEEWTDEIGCVTMYKGVLDSRVIALYRARTPTEGGTLAW